MKLALFAALAAFATAAAVPVARAQIGGYGPGMMGGYGGYGSYGMGPGMMGGWGGYGAGPGAMGGYGGYGMGPGTMYGYGPGPGMRYGYGAGALDTLNLTDEQRAKIAKIDEALATKRWELMGKMQDQRFRLRDLLASGNADDAAIGKAYRSIDTLRQQMWTAASDAQKQVDGVLTPAQREQLQRGWGRDAR